MHLDHDNSCQVQSTTIIIGGTCVPRHLYMAFILAYCYQAKFSRERLSTAHVQDQILTNLAQIEKISVFEKDMNSTSLKSNRIKKFPHQLD